tara:strand:+ start:260 stop:610 length:351 start_codon:yes stop_codon:yes gene_type:complete
MKLDFNIQLNQKQGLALTAQVQQAIKLLHMTNLEIQEFVSEQFQDNPFIETNDFSESKDNLVLANQRILMSTNLFRKIPTLNKKQKLRSPSKINLKPERAIFLDPRFQKLIPTLIP